MSRFAKILVALFISVQLPVYAASPTPTPIPSPSPAQKDPADFWAQFVINPPVSVCAPTSETTSQSGSPDLNEPQFELAAKNINRVPNSAMMTCTTCRTKPSTPRTFKWGKHPKDPNHWCRAVTASGDECLLASKCGWAGKGVAPSKTCTTKLFTQQEFDAGNLMLDQEGYGCDSANPTIPVPLRLDRCDCL